ncbi:MAG: DUF3179 domain-containing (seleno)protein [Thermoanaerobaculia bacterium]
MWRPRALPIALSAVLFHPASFEAAGPPDPDAIHARPDLYQPLTEPPCSYCSTQNRKGFIEGRDAVVTWLRGAHNGGAIPIRHFLSAPRVINDTYGLFFYDPDGGYVAAYRKDYGYRFHGWRRGVMVARGPDGTLWSALSGRALQGPKKGERLTRVPSLVTTWEHWLMLHPESTAYDLFDGKRYPTAPLPAGMSREARESMGEVDGRLKPLADVLGVEAGGKAMAFPLDPAVERACFNGAAGGEPVAVFWYGLTRSAVGYKSTLDGRKLTFFAASNSPETAPITDRETGTRWTLAGRGIDGPLRGKELDWIDSIHCRWYAWAAENPGTEVHKPAE